MKKTLFSIIFIFLIPFACTQDDEGETFGSYDVGELYGRCKEDRTCNNGLKCINGFCKIITDSGGSWGGSFSGGNDTPDSGTTDSGGNAPGNCKDFSCKGCCTSSGYWICLLYT
ncbi:MAG: hypothetical protein N3B13_00500, partial [Deltaproteobacteria bacterium]|nr:hypothetical protein [Deltaproteobacteria bacterium]